MSESQQELLRRLREQAWNEGYDVCRKGGQQRNPYRVTEDRVKKAQELAKEGRNNSWIAYYLGVTEEAVRELLVVKPNRP